MLQGQKTKMEILHIQTELFSERLDLYQTSDAAPKEIRAQASTSTGLLLESYVYFGAALKVPNCLTFSTIAMAHFRRIGNWLSFTLFPSLDLTNIAQYLSSTSLEKYLGEFSYGFPKARSSQDSPNILGWIHSWIYSSRSPVSPRTTADPPSASISSTVFSKDPRSASSVPTLD